MSTKIFLDFKSNIDLELLKDGVRLELIRILAKIRFATKQGWTDYYKAILDTGSPTSIIPFSIWQEIKTMPLSTRKIKLHGIGSKEESTISGKMANLTCALLDEKFSSPPLTIKAYLVEDDSVPLILGFDGILTRSKFFCDYKNKTAYLKISLA